MNTQRSILQLILYGLGVMAVLALIWFLGYRLLFLPAENAQNKATAVTQEERAVASAEVGQAGMEIVRETRVEYERVDELTRRNRDEIERAPGAQDRAPAVADAMRRGLCQHRTYQSEPGCAAMLGHDAGLGPAGAYSGRSPTR